MVPALPAGVAAEQRLGLKVGDSSFSWPLKQCDANAALEGSSRGRGLARCAVFPCVPREKMKNTKKSGWNTLARHAENISEQRFIPYLAKHSFSAGEGDISVCVTRQSRARPRRHTRCAHVVAVTLQHADDGSAEMRPFPCPTTVSDTAHSHLRSHSLRTSHLHTTQCETRLTSNAQKTEPTPFPLAPVHTHAPRLFETLISHQTAPSQTTRWHNQTRVWASTRLIIAAASDCSES